MDVVTITLNPAIDKSFTVDQLVPEHKLRCPNPLVDPGGGGINVSKGLKALHCESLAIFFAGGMNGNYLRQLLKEQQINIHPITIEGETRESIVITDKSTGKEYRIVVEGPPVTSADLDKVIHELKAVKPKYIVASGSLPKGLPEDAFAKVAHAAKELGSRFVLDTSGKPLQLAATEGVFLLKPNLRELSSLAGVDSLQLNDVDDAAMELIKRGECQVVVVSLSSSGAMLVTKDGYWQIPAPTVERKSTVGAGDSMVAGMVWSLLQGKSFDSMAKMGVACGTAATMSPGTKLFNKPDAEKLLNWIEARK